MSLPKVTVMGGGTGTFVVLSGMKKYPINLGVVVAMTDSGGSTGKLRDQYGVLPPGDLRQCLVALSESDEIWRELFLYRFDRGDFRGHNFGNVFLTVLETIAPSYNKVITLASKILNVKGEIYPVTLKKTNLLATYENGNTLQGESLIDKDNNMGKITSLSLHPQSNAHKDALDRLKKSDVIVIGPGDLFTSLIPCLLPLGVTKVLATSNAKIVFIVNLMNKHGQTDSLTASGHVKVIEEYLKRKVDKIVINNTPFPKSAISYYGHYEEDIVLDDLLYDKRVVRGDILSYTRYRNKKGDTLKRSLLRHDPDKLSELIYKLI